MTGTAIAGNRTTWTIDPAHSTIEFVAKHMMITTVKGRFADVTGTIVADEATFADSTVEVTMQAESLDTRTGERDAHLRSPDFFDVEKFPTASFKSSRIEASGGDRYRVTGDLTLHGVTRPVVLNATYEGAGKDPWGGERAGFSASLTIDRKDFGLEWNKALETGGLLVGEKVELTLEVEAVKQAQQQAA
jgi:polyisoprenoid-binding protein YceI